MKKWRSTFRHFKDKLLGFVICRHYDVQMSLSLEKYMHFTDFDDL